MICNFSVTAVGYWAAFYLPCEENFGMTWAKEIAVWRDGLVEAGGTCPDEIRSPARCPPEGGLNKCLFLAGAVTRSLVSAIPRAGLAGEASGLPGASAGQTPTPGSAERSPTQARVHCVETGAVVTFVARVSSPALVFIGNAAGGDTRATLAPGGWMTDPEFRTTHREKSCLSIRLHDHSVNTGCSRPTRYP
jgi:hypothetical protein